MPERSLAPLLASGRPLIMGVLNITPDSFSDGGVFLARAPALAHALEMVREGADIVDIGGESTRPGAAEVSVGEELARVIPVIEALRAASEVAISVDTSKPEVMRAAVAAGADMINDVNALCAPGALAAAAATSAHICLMHKQGTPRTMQQQPHYDDVVTQVRDYLAQRVVACTQSGIARERLIIDPGFGFGKTVAHNLALLRRLRQLTTLEIPLLAGLSRKSMIGVLLDLPVERRLYASLALAMIAVQNGAQIIRVHDVRATKELLAMQQIVAASDE